MKRPTFVSAIVSLVVAVTLLTPPVHAASPGILPPTSKPHGASYGEWMARWWQWALSVPADRNANLDMTGTHCHEGQSGKLWFWSVYFGAPHDGEGRTCVMPSGTMLFVPVFLTAFDNTTCGDDVNYTPKEMRAILDEQIRGFNKAVTMIVEIDGVRVQNIKRYRAQSPVFAATLPTDNILKALGCDDVEAGTLDPMVADGYVLILEPLPVGRHTLRMGVVGEGFEFWVTHYPTVVPRGQYGR